jgi:transitional endoplasmic reticulum ATPase
VRFLLENFEAYKKEGLEAYAREDYPRARFALLKAAEFLFKLADKSDGIIRKSRIENANKLMELAKKIEHAERREPRERLTEREGEEGESKFAAAEMPGISFSDIAGLEDVKEEIYGRVIYPLKFPDKAKKYGMLPGGGILLFGPPGTGKTMIARAIANEVKAPFYTVKPSEIMSKWVGEAEKNIAALFKQARKHSLSVIFIDEIESLIPRRSTSGSTVMQRVVPQILAELEGFDAPKRNPMLFIGATNEPWLIDSAVLRPGRFDELIYVGLPDREARRKILELNLEDKPLTDDVNLDELADMLEGYSGADIRNICANVAQEAFLDSVREDVDRAISHADLVKTAKKARRSVTDKQLKKFEKYLLEH